VRDVGRLVRLAADRLGPEVRRVGLDEQAIEPIPEVGGKWQSDYAAGIGRKGEKFVVIFDLAKLMAHDEIPGEAPRAA